MKQTLFSILLFCAVGLLSCRKDKNDQTIKEYDESQITSYISTHGITGMVKSTDTTGIYYNIINSGKGTAITYPDKILIVFTVSSFDGKFISSDTISNHVYDYLGHMTTHNLPNGLQLSLLNILKYRGSKARLLIPSRMGYGISGYGSGSSTANNRIAGNQCLDYTISIVDNSSDLAAYDELSIKKFIAANNLSGFLPTGTGLYYKVTQAGTGTIPVIATSVVSVQYTGKLLNGLMFDGYNNTDNLGLSLSISDVIPGWQEGLKYGTDGAKLSLIVPSRLAYKDGTTATTIPAYSCLYFDINLLTVTN